MELLIDVDDIFRKFLDTECIAKLQSSHPLLKREYFRPNRQIKWLLIPRLFASFGNCFDIPFSTNGVNYLRYPGFQEIYKKQMHFSLFSQIQSS